MREKKCAVIGLARAGIPAARFLAERGAQVFGYDDKDFWQLSDEARALRGLGVELITGKHGYAGIERCGTVVLSPGLKVHHEPLRSVIERCEQRHVEVIGELELAARHCPAPIIAVTGTKGKSTTVKLITEMLQACGIDALRAGNTGIPLIAELPKLSPQSWAVVEVSSFQLERTPTFKPRIAVLLNLLQDHLDYHTSLQQYWETKFKLFAHQHRGDTAIFNRDDKETAALRGGELWNNLQQEGVRCLYSSGRPAEDEMDVEGEASVDVGVRDGALGWYLNGKFLAVLPVQEIPLRGAHNVSNVAAALAAVAAVLGEGVESHREKVADAIRQFEGLPHRLEIVGVKGGVTWVNDSQSTIPQAAIKALQAFPAPVTLIAGGKDKLGDPFAYTELGQAIAESAYRLITIGEAAGTIAEVARRAGFDNTKIVNAQTLTNAVRHGKMLTPSGGTVVLSPACASFDQFKSYEDRGEQFRAAVAALPE